MSKKSRVLSIAFVTGEDIEPKSLPVLKVHKGKNQYIVLEGEEAITSALVQSLEHLVRFGPQFWLNILLTLFGYFPGLIHAVWIISKE